MKQPSPFKRISLALVASFAGLLLLSTSQAQTLASWDFENWPDPQRLTSTAYDGWIGNDNETTQISRAVTPPAGSPSAIGSRSLFLRDTSNATFANAQFSLGENLTRGYIEFSLRRADSTSGNLYLRLRDAGTTTNNMQLFINSGSGGNPGTIRFVAYNNGTIAVDQSVSYSTAGYTDFAWNTFRINFDEISQTASILINNSVVSGLSIGNLNDLDLRAGNFLFVAGEVASTNAGAYIDNVSVVAIPEKSTVSLVLAGTIVALAICIRRRNRMMPSHKA